MRDYPPNMDDEIAFGALVVVVVLVGIGIVLGAMLF